ncbi:substrate-binding periplasmic protein [Pseudochrobactrum asaccharolyticum]|uniref:substrate-binding periplasmic protein n=1 Tax=Pseudochrobactrum asaccharolyticum TaxID=354351 RepID=UPI0040432CD9
MKKHITITIAAALGTTMLASAAFAQDCKPLHNITTVEAGYLTIAAPTFPPFSIPKGESDLTGVDGEIVKEIAAKECLKIKVAAVEYATAIPFVVSGRADIAIGNYYRTDERQKAVNLSAPLYLDEMGLYSKEGVTTVTQLEGRNVGTVQGYLWVNELKAVLGDKLSLYNNYVALYQDLEAGRIEIAVDGIAVGTAAQQGGALKGIQIKVAEKDERVQSSVYPAQAGLPLSKNNPDLLVAADDVVKELHKSGRMVEILKEFGLSDSAADVGEPRLIK